MVLNKLKLMGDAIMKKGTIYALVAGTFFMIGGYYIEAVVKKYITDDCRVIGATRFGEVYIKCTTIQKYD